MQKTLLYFAVLAILGFGVWFFLFSGPGNLFDNSEAGFTVKDTGAIGKIFLADNGGKSMTLLRTDSGWLANNHRALAPQVKYLLTTLAQQEPVSPVTEVQHNSVVRSLAGTSIKAEIYNRRGDKIRTFYVGGEVQNFGGTYMLMEGAKKPFVVNIRGYDGYLTPRYSPAADVWLDRTIFNIGADDIAQVAVDYPFNPARSFSLARSANDSFAVTLSQQQSATQAMPMNRARTRAYLGFFTHVSGESVVNGLPHLDSVIRSMPVVYKVAVKGKNNHSEEATFYFYPLNARSKNLGMPITDTSSYYDADRLFAVVHGGQDTLAVQKAALDKILRTGKEFFEADTAETMQPQSILPRGVKMRP